MNKLRLLILLFGLFMIGCVEKIERTKFCPMTHDGMCDCEVCHCDMNSIQIPHGQSIPE
jgi:nitrous oxide reductase accessory protein NosL